MTETRAPAETIRAPVIPRPGMAKDWETWAEQVSKVLEDHLDQLARKLNSIDTEVLVRDVDKDLTNQGNALWAVDTNTLPSQLQDIRQRIEDVAATHATETANIYDTVDEHKVEYTDNNIKAFAAIVQEATLRVSADDAQALVAIGLRSDITDLQDSVSGSATAIQSLETHVTNIDGTLTSQAQSILDLQSDVADANLGISANATATETLTTQVSHHEDQLTAQVQSNTFYSSSIDSLTNTTSAHSTQLNSITTTVTNQGNVIAAHSSAIQTLQSTIGQKAEASAVQSLDTFTRVDLQGQVNAVASAQTSLTSTVNGHTANISQLSQSVSGLGVRWSIIGTIDETTGGLRFEGIQRADGGGVAYVLDVFANAKFHGDVVIDGTLNWPAMVAGAGAQVYFAGPTNGGCSIEITGRDNNVILIGVFEGKWDSPTTAFQGSLYMTCDGNTIRAPKQIQWGTDTRSGSGTFFSPLETSMIASHNPGLGQHSYTFASDLAYPCTLLIIVPR